MADGDSEAQRIPALSSRWPRQILHIFLIYGSAVLVGCASTGLWDYERRTFECDQMQTVCKNAREYEKQYEAATAEEQLHMRPTLEARQSACIEAQKTCHESQRRAHDLDPDKGLR